MALASSLYIKKNLILHTIVIVTKFTFSTSCFPATFHYFNFASIEDYFDVELCRLKYGLAMVRLALFRLISCRLTYIGST